MNTKSLIGADKQNQHVQAGSLLFAAYGHELFRGYDMKAYRLTYRNEIEMASSNPDGYRRLQRFTLRKTVDGWEKAVALMLVLDEHDQVGILLISSYKERASEPPIFESERYCMTQAILTPQQITEMARKLVHATFEILDSVKITFRVDPTDGFKLYP